MKAMRSGNRYPLLFYRRTMGRIWKATFILGLVVAAAGWWALLNKTIFLGFSSDMWLFMVAFLAFAISIFAFIANYLAYVQAHESYLFIATPFLRFRISFRRIRSAHPVLVQQLFPKEKSSWAERSFLDPFYGKTALVIELNGYPIQPALLKLFLPAQMFSPRSTGLVLMVSDWMKLSTEFDSLKGAWLQMQSSRMRKARL